MFFINPVPEYKIIRQNLLNITHIATYTIFTLYPRNAFSNAIQVCLFVIVLKMLIREFSSLVFSGGGLTPLRPEKPCSSNSFLPSFLTTSKLKKDGVSNIF